jgi:mannose-6-phosphate isomerase-like protein (cupin superfamily)
MFIRELDACTEITASDGSTLRELFNPLKDDLGLRYSLAHARVMPGQATIPHILRSSEVYYIIEGEGVINIDGETAKARPGQAIYIPPGAVQYITNTGEGELVFLCMVDPAWRAEDEEIPG